jgi:hypothetical protein
MNGWNYEFSYTLKSFPVWVLEHFRQLVFIAQCGRTVWRPMLIVLHLFIQSFWRLLFWYKEYCISSNWILQNGWLHWSLDSKDVVRSTATHQRYSVLFTSPRRSNVVAWTKHVDVDKYACSVVVRRGYRNKLKRINILLMNKHTCRPAVRYQVFVTVWIHSYCYVLGSGTAAL